MRKSRRLFWVLIILGGFFLTGSAGAHTIQFEVLKLTTLSDNEPGIDEYTILVDFNSYWGL